MSDTLTNALIAQVQQLSRRLSTLESAEYTGQASSLKPWFDVKRYGATGDGTTDDRAAIIAACTACNAASGGVVYLPSGTYYVDTDSYDDAIYLPSNCHLWMAPDAVVQLATLDAGDNGHAVFRINAKSNVHVSGGTIIGQRTGPSSGEHGFAFYVTGGSSNVLIENVNIRDMWGDGIYVGGSTVNTGIKIKNCTIDNCRRNGITVVFGDNVLIEGNTITDTNGTAPQTGIDLEPNSASSQYVRNVRIIGNHLENNTSGGIDLNGNQGALGAVDVSGCVVTGNVVKATGATTCISLHGPNTWDCVVTGNYCYGGYGIYATGTADGAVKRCVIEANHCYDGVTGLYLGSITNCIVRGNLIYSPSSYGIRLFTADTLISALVTVSDNVIDDGGDYGIYLQECVRCNIIGNIVNDSDEQGIYFSGAGQDCIIALNQIYGCGTDGGAAATAIDIFLPDYCLITNNMIRANSVTTKGIWLRSGSNYNMVLNNDVAELAAGSAIDNDGTGTVTTSGNRTA